MKHIKQDFRSKAWVDLIRGGVKAQNSTISEYGHVAYQIKGNNTCSNMVASILPYTHPRPVVKTI